MSDYHESNRRGWNAVSDNWQARVEAEGIWRQAPRDPALVFPPEEMRWLGDLAGRQVCVLGSGDNLSVFALAGMGAHVTSVDISETQLATAERRARELCLDARFLPSDVTDLGALPSAAFDLVYTGGHVAVWVSDLKRYYREAVRILKSGGIFLVSEYHPFRRIWKWGSDRFEIETRYFDRGPFQFDRSEEAGSPPGTLPSYEFNWTVSDHVMAVIEAGCELLQLAEFGDGRQFWEQTDLEGLPESLLLVGKKRHA